MSKRPRVSISRLVVVPAFVAAQTIYRLRHVRRAFRHADALYAWVWHQDPDPLLRQRQEEIQKDRKIDRDLLRTVRDVVSDSDILQWEDIPEKERALAALDDLIGSAP